MALIRRFSSSRSLVRLDTTRISSVNVTTAILSCGLSTSTKRSAADFTTSNLSLIEPDKSRASTRLNGAVVGWKNSIFCDSPFSATVKSSFFRLGSAIPERLVTETWRLTNAAFSMIASSSELLAFVSGDETVSLIGGSSPRLRFNTGGPLSRELLDGTSSSTREISGRRAAPDDAGSYGRADCLPEDVLRLAVEGSAASCSLSSRWSKTAFDSRDGPGGALAGMIRTRRPEFPPPVLFSCRSLSMGPTLDLLEPISERSLPPSPIEPFPQLLLEDPFDFAEPEPFFGCAS